LEIDIAEIWLEVDQVVERIATLKEKHGSITSQVLRAGTDTAFGIGPIDRPLPGVVGNIVHIYQDGVKILEANTWELNYVGVGAALGMKAGSAANGKWLDLFISDWNDSQKYHQPMVAGKQRWGQIGSEYGRFVYNGRSLTGHSAGIRYNFLKWSVNRFSKY